jgi:hypothetical protein
MSKSTKGAKGAQRNRLSDRHLWDDTGREWSYVTNQVRAAEVKELLQQPTLRFCVHENYGAPLVWLSQEDAKKFWESTASKDYAGEKATVKRPNMLPWQVSIFRDGDERVVLFDSD